ncbi:MAG: dephospho-CoA kinase [Verrucomicrobiota bacterium]|nr:dephospho-CoA kinase [Verrucomicrobiota bacterium]
MRIGLTGGIGCGKSTVLAEFASRGARTLDSDGIVRRLLSTDAEIHSKLREHFGPGIFHHEGGVDRKALAHRVFHDTSDLKYLESVLHPKVREEYLAEMKSAPDAFWVAEIPLLFENRLETYFDFCVCVETALTTQLARLHLRGLGEAEALSRMARQMPLSEKIRRSHYVLSNNGSIENLRRQVDVLMNHLEVTL